MVYLIETLKLYYSHLFGKFENELIFDQFWWHLRHKERNLPILAACHDFDPDSSPTFN